MYITQKKNGKLLTVSAPLHINFIRPFGSLTITDIRFLADVNSNTFSISYRCLTPIASISTLSGVLLSKTYPNLQAPYTNALSSGEAAWYTTVPSVNFSGMTVWHTDKSTRSSFRRAAFLWPCSMCWKTKTIHWSTGNSHVNVAIPFWYFCAQNVLVLTLHSTAAI